METMQAITIADDHFSITKIADDLFMYQREVNVSCKGDGTEHYQLMTTRNTSTQIQAEDIYSEDVANWAK